MSPLAVTLATITALFGVNILTRHTSATVSQVIAVILILVGIFALIIGAGK